MLYYFWLLSSLLLTSTAIFADRISVADAVENGQVGIYIQNIDEQISGKCMQIKLQNQTDQDLEIIIESGRLLHSKDSTVQDFVITQGQLAKLAPRQAITKNLYGMCIQNTYGAPQEGDRYTLGAMADEALFKLIKLIERNHYQDQTAQHAVWVVTNDAPIAGIYDENDARKSKALTEFVAELVDQTVPWYKVVYEGRERGEQVFSGDVARIDATFKYSLRWDAPVTFGIYHADDRPLQVYFEEVKRPKGNHRLKFSFEAKGLPHGTYYAKLMVDGEVIERRALEL